jgi:hypothetical protein
MELEIIMLSEMSQTEKDIPSHIQNWDLKNKMNGRSAKDENCLGVGTSGRKGGWKERVKGTWILSKYSTHMYENR